MKVFLTGATGFVGRALAGALLARGDRVVALSRSGRAPEGTEAVSGDPAEAGPWTERVSGCDAVVHLAGEPIAGKRWSAAQKRKIRDSRVAGTTRVAEAIAAAAARPRALLAANGADYYPFDDSSRGYDESAPAGDTFLAEVCAAWQAAAETAPVRTVVFRTGVVLGPGGGALERLTTVFRAFLGGPVGSGNQWMSWVHLEDVVGAYLHALDGELAGPVNLVAPGAVRWRELARELGKVLHRPAGLPAPAFAVKLALGEVAEYLVHGRRVVPRALERAGFAFRHAALDDALRACYFM